VGKRRSKLALHGKMRLCWEHFIDSNKNKLTIKGSCCTGIASEKNSTMTKRREVSLLSMAKQISVGSTSLTKE